jgi:hypothetical protein
MVFYKAVLESNGDYVIVHEAFSDFFSFIRKVIDKIIDFVKSLFKRFITSLNSAIKREQYLKNHKDDFKNFGKNHEFKFDGYEFSILPGIPKTDVLQSFADSMNDIDLAQFASREYPVGGPTKDATIKTHVQKKYDDMVADNDGSYYDRKRGETIGKPDEAITQSDYANVLFSLFRNEVSSKEEIDVTAPRIVEFYSRFEGSKSLETQITKEKDAVEKAYKDIKNKVEKALKRTADGKNIRVATGVDTEDPEIAVSADVVQILDLFVKAKANQIQMLSDIHTLAFSAKLDAISDCFKQDKAVLYKALYKIQGINKEDK